MFEKRFEAVGRFSERNSGKIIIFWIILILVLAPFASLLFHETSYDLTSSIVPPNAMATKSSNLEKLYFQNNSTSGSSNGTQSMVMVTTNTSINSTPQMGDMISAQNSVEQYLTGQGINVSFESIVGTENETLHGVAAAASGFLKLAYPLLDQFAQSSHSINQSLNASLSIIIGIPAYYLGNLSEVNSPSTAYNSTLHFIDNIGMVNPLFMQIGIPYFNTFAALFNGSFAINPGKPLNDINSSILGASLNQSLNNTLGVVIRQGGTLGSFAALFYQAKLPIAVTFNVTEYPINTDGQFYSRFAYNFTVPILAQGISSNSTIVSALQNDLNITPYELAGDAYNLSQPADSVALQSESDRVVANGIISYFRGSPLIAINPERIQAFVSSVNITSDLNVTISQLMLDYNFSSYPAVPQSYVLHQFVGYDNSTVITILLVSSNLTLTQTNKVSSIYTDAFHGVDGVGTYLAGSSALSSQLGSESISGMERALFIGIVLSVIIVGVFFLSPVAAFLPLMIFGVSAEVSMALNGLLYKYILHGTVSFITPTLLLILLLGLASDYVVYIMSRYRREIRSGNEHPSVVSAKWSGHAVFTSGITVAISYIVLYLSHVPIFSDAGITNAVGVIVTILAANTLLLAILNRGKRKLFWPSKISTDKHLPAEKTMKKIAGAVIANKGKIVIIFVVASLLASYVYFETPSNFDVFNLVPSSSGIQAIKVVNSSFNGDLFDRGYVILQFQSPVYNGTAFNTTEINSVTAIEQKLLTSGHVSEVFGPTYPYGDYVPANLSGIRSSYSSQYLSEMKSYIGSDSRYVIIDYQLSELAWLNPSTKFVNDIPSVISSTGSDYKVYVGGITEGLNNAYSYTLSSFIKMVPILAIAIFAVLLIQLSSLFTPLRLILMVLASVIISLAITYLAVHYYAGLPILIFLPMFTVITLLAVGLDYDIFMVTRVREEAYKGKSDEEGVRVSLEENGGVIITLGVLLFATFGSLAFSGIGIIQEIGIGLALGVLVDTFVSWPFFVPAIMLYLKKYNWWPSKLKREEVDELPGEKE
ncbi:MAG: MMPL family transporter [Candidatus Thermoplasmatota archaeon]|nr:MMPL family transporter [Candidatus Thermoplasmatota archaeon]